MEKLDILKTKIERVDAERIVSCLESMLAEGKTSIGQGDNAEVFTVYDEKYNDLCVKESKKHKKLLVNDEETEMNIQEDVWRRSVNVPRPICYLTSRITGKFYIVMQKIEGCTLGEILKNGVLPDTYNHDFFWKNLKEQLKRMHNENGLYGEGGVHHRDLHENNIMFEYETGKPVIIDFGTATYALSDERNEVYRQEAMIMNPVTGKYEKERGRFKSDVGMALAIEQNLKNLTKYE